MIKEIVNSILTSRIKQEDNYLSEDIEQLQNNLMTLEKTLLNKSN